MATVPCPHCNAIVEVDSNSNTGTASCKSCGKTIQTTDSLRIEQDSGSSPATENPFIFDRPKTVFAPKAVETPSPAPKNAPTAAPAMGGTLPDFAALAAGAASKPVANQFPDFSVNTGKKAKAASDAPATVPFIATTPVAKKSDAPSVAPAAAQESNVKELLPSFSVSPPEKKNVAVSAKEKAVASPAQSSKAVPAPVSPKSNASAASSLAGFREFAALAGASTTPNTAAVSSPVVSVASSTTEGKSTKPVVMDVAATIKGNDQAPISPLSSIAAVPAKRVHAITVFGQSWVPYVTDVMSLVLVGSMLYYTYVAMTIEVPGAASGIAAIAIASGFGAALMAAMSLVLRLLSQLSHNRP